jgi:glycosyltransferase involved in cell wall biosynthesis
MKVLHVETGRFLYGGAQQVAYLLKALPPQVESVLVCPPDADIAEAAAPYATVIPTPMGGDLDIAFVWRLRQVIQQYQPDIVHLHSRRGADVLGALAARWAKVPCVLSRRVDNPEPRWLVPLKYALYDRVITISEGIKRVLMACGVSADQITCVRSAVDFERFQLEPDRSWFEQTFQLPPGARVVAVVAQLIERKGHRYVLDSAPALLAAFPDVHILFFGKGPLAGALQERIDHEGLGDRVRLVGFRDDMPRVLPNISLLAHPADAEGLGVSLIQAAAAGIPIVATAAGGIPEVVRDGHNGVLVSPGDSAGLQKALLALLSDPELAQGFGARGREMARDEFSIAAMALGNLAVYESLLSRSDL